jgi:hypothetical protein
MKRARWVGIALAAVAVVGSPAVVAAPVHAAQPAHVNVADTQCQTLYARYLSNLNLYHATGNYTYYVVARQYLSAWAALCV